MAERGLFFEELSIGQSVEHTRVVGESDIAAFAAVSGDDNPVHLDAAFAATTPFKERIAHGMLTASYTQASGVSVFDGLQRRLALPLGMEHFRQAEHTQWELERSSNHPAYVMQLSARDFARIGLLMARGGLWRGERLLSAAWVADSTRAHSEVPPGWSGYGYLWWVPLRSFDFWTRQPGSVFFASGSHGQVLWVDRARDIVVVHGTDHRRWLRASPSVEQLVPLLKQIFSARPAE